MNQITQVRLAQPGWSPHRFQVPAYRPGLAQAVTAAPSSPISPYPAVKPVPFIDSALVSFIFDALGAGAFGTLAYSTENTTWRVINSIITGVFIFKGLADLSDVRKR